MKDAGLRYGFVGIIVDNPDVRGAAVQEVLSGFSSMILGRMGLPHLEDDRLAVITLIVKSDTDEIGALTGRLGRLPGVSVKSGLTPVR